MLFPRHTTHAVGILGGMGPAAGADFVKRFVSACTQHRRGCGVTVSDQAFPEHWLAQVPAPDRCSAMAAPGFGAHQPLEPMLQAVGELVALGTTTINVACNTAHAWHGQLQQRFRQPEVLCVAREAAHTLAWRGVREISLSATIGTCSAGLYNAAFALVDMQCHTRLPGECWQ